MIKTKLRVGLIAISSVLALSASPAFSQEAETESSEPTVENAYTQCGIGAALFPNSGTAAAFSNAIWDFGTTALSSQTSSPSTCAGATTTAAIFIHQTHKRRIIRRNPYPFTKLIIVKIIK